MALPFAIIQHVGFQNLIWLGAFILLALTYFRSRLTAFIFMCVILANAHTFVNLLTGADYPTNWFYVAVASFLFLRSASGWPRWASSILLGLALSSRPTYLLFFPPLLLALLIQRDGLPRAVARLAPPLVLCSIVTLSFYLYAPSRFSPLHVTGFLSFTPSAYRLIAMAAILGPALAVAVSSFFIRMSVPRVFLLASNFAGDCAFSNRDCDTASKRADRGRNDPAGLYGRGVRLLLPLGLPISGGSRHPCGTEKLGVLTLLV